MSSRPATPLFVLDASVAVKWFLTDEGDRGPAEALLRDFRDDRVRLIAPEQIRYEVPSAIRNALRTNRITVDQARSAISRFLAWQVPTFSSDEVVLTAYEQSLRFGSSFYDGLYLALAEMSETPLIHADARLRNALGDRFPLAIWLADYKAVDPHR